jgi:hypothetical protein
VFQLTGVGTQPPSGGGRRKRRPKRLTAAEVRALDRVWLGLPPEAKEVPTPGEYEVVGITEFSIQDTSRASVEYATRNHGSAAFVDDLDASLEVRNGDDAEVLFSSANQPAIDVSPDLEPELVHVASRSAVSTDLWMNRPISKDEALAAIAKAGKRLTKKRQ